MAALKLFSTFALTTLVMAQQKQMVLGPFNTTAYNELMDCIKNASTRYDVAIDSGTIIIIPPQGEAIDLDSNADNALGNCLDIFSVYLDLAVDDSRICVDDNGAVTTTYALATAEWAESNGAQGMTSRNSTRVGARGLDFGDSGTAGLLPRQVTKDYFFPLASD